MHQIDGTTFPAFSLWKAAEWVAQLTHRLNLPRSPLHDCAYRGGRPLDRVADHI